jgi:glycogen(starch) synthase
VATYNYYVAHGLVQLGHHVTIVCAGSSGEDPGFEVDGQIEIHRLSPPHSPRLRRVPIVGRYMRAVEQYGYSRLVARKLNELERANGIDVGEFAEVNGEGFAYLRQRKRKPVVVRCHTPTFVLRKYAPQGSMRYDTTLVSWMEKATIRGADALTAPSADMARTIERSCDLGLDSIRVIPNALDVESLAPAGDRFDADGLNDLIVLHVGRLELVKGIEVLAQAIPCVLRRVPRARFVFIGEARTDDQRAFWERTLYNAGGSRIEVLGSLGQAEVITWYRKAHAAVVPTLNYESFSYTCAEAMAAGLALVASRIGGIPETLEDGVSGILVTPGDSQALASALIRVLEDAPLRARLGHAGLMKAGSDFAANKVAKQTSRVYASVAAL